MPLITLDPQTALIIVDLQKGIVSSPFIHPIEAHEYSLRHVFPRLGETGSTQDVLDLLAKRST